MILGGEREERGATISLEEEAVDKKLEAPTYFVVFFSTRIDFISVIWKVFVYRTKVPRDKVVLSLEFFFPSTVPQYVSFYKQEDDLFRYLRWTCSRAYRSF